MIKYECREVSLITGDEMFYWEFNTLEELNDFMNDPENDDPNSTFEWRKWDSLA